MSTTVNVSNGPSSAPNTQGTWTSPEGVTITVNSAGTNPDTGKSWTIADVYSMLIAQTTANATVHNVFLQFAPNYTIDLQDQNSSTTYVSWTNVNGANEAFSANTELMGVNSTFAAWPDYVLGHEYGVAWTQYLWVMQHQASWNLYLGERADGSTYNGATYQLLGQDARLYQSQSWMPAEIIADDYRMLFGSATAISQHPYNINTTIVDPRNQTGLGDWLLQQWA